MRGGVRENLPKAWAWTTLGELTSEIRERADPRSLPQTSYLGLEHIEGGTGKILGVGGSEEVRSTVAVFRPGDVLYGRLRPYLNKVCRPELPGVASTEFLVFRETEALSNRLLRYLLSSRSLVSYAHRNSKGVNLPRVASEKIAQFSVWLPPRQEQDRIASKIEELFSELDAGVAALERAQAKLERYRASVLKAAVEGRLTEQWRKENPPEETGEYLLKRILAERRKSWEEEQFAAFQGKGTTPPKGWREKYKEPERPDASGLPKLPEGWCWGTVEQVCSHVVDCPHSTPQWTDDGMLCVRTTEFRPGHLELSEARFVSRDTYLSRTKRLRPEAGDILYSREGAILGIACPVPQGVELCLGQRMLLLRAASDYSPPFLMHFLNSPLILREVKKRTGGSASPHLNVNEIRRFPTPIPSHAEQAQIVHEVEARILAVVSCSGLLESAGVRMNALRQSILKLAFEGRLVPQDPNDEPASVLLERIRAPRKAEKPAAKRPRKPKSRQGSLKL